MSCIFEGELVCKVNNIDASDNYLLLGDSHSIDLSHSFKKYVNSNEVNGWQLSTNGCHFYLSNKNNSLCNEIFNNILDDRSSLLFERKNS